MTVKTLVSGVAFNSKGIATGWNEYSDASHNSTNVKYGVGTIAESNEVIGLGGTYYAYADDCKVYYLSTTGEMSQSTAASITDDVDNQVWFKLTDGVVSNIFIQVVDVPGTVTGDSTAALAAVAATGASGTLTVNLQTNATATTTADIKGTVTISVLNGGTWVKVRDVEVTIPTGTSANGWGNQVVVSGLLAGQYKVECGNLTPAFAVVTA